MSTRTGRRPRRSPAQSRTARRLVPRKATCLKKRPAGGDPIHCFSFFPLMPIHTPSGTSLLLQLRLFQPNNSEAHVGIGVPSGVGGEWAWRGLGGNETVGASSLRHARGYSIKGGRCRGAVERGRAVGGRGRGVGGVRAQEDAREGTLNR